MKSLPSKTFWAAGLALLAGLTAGAASLDIYSVSGTNPRLDQATPFRDLNLDGEFIPTDGQSALLPDDENCCVFSPDGKSLWVQTQKQQAAGPMAHILRLDPLTGTKTYDIPIDSRWPGNPFQTAFGHLGLKAEAGEMLAVSDKYLAVLVKAGSGPRRWVPVLYDLNGRFLKLLPVISGSYTSRALNLSFSDDSRYLIVEHDAPNSLYLIETASGRSRQLNFGFLLEQAGYKSLGSRFYPLPGGQVAFFVESAKTPSQKRVIVLDLDAAGFTAELGAELEMDPHPVRKGILDNRGQMLIMPARAGKDKESCGSGPCLRLFRFPGLEEMVRFKVKTAKGTPLLDYINGGNQRMALSEYDSRLLIVGSNTKAKTDYAMLLDTISTGEILSWVRLPVRHDAWFRLGTRREGGYWVLGAQPAPGGGLRLFRF